MNTVSESTKNVAASAVGTKDHLDEAWFSEEPPASSRPSSIPPSHPIKIGDFVGDPDVDGWLR